MGVKKTMGKRKTSNQGNQSTRQGFRRGIKLQVVGALVLAGLAVAVGGFFSVTNGHAQTTTAVSALVPLTGHLKESFGPGYYVGTPSLDYNHAVIEEFGGRLMKFQGNGGKYCNAVGTCWPTGTLVFTSGTNKCAGAPNFPQQVQVTHCSGDTAIIWAEKVQNGHIHFINDYWSDQIGLLQYLNGPCGSTASNFSVHTAPPSQGAGCQAFDFL